MSQNSTTDAPACEASAPTIAQVLGDPSASFWLKSALQSSLQRDPVDAAHDADLLGRLLDSRLEMLTESLLKARRA